MGLVYGLKNSQLTLVWQSSLRYDVIAFLVRSVAAKPIFDLRHLSLMLFEGGEDLWATWRG